MKKAIALIASVLLLAALRRPARTAKKCGIAISYKMGL